MIEHVLQTVPALPPPPLRPYVSTTIQQQNMGSLNANQFSEAYYMKALTTFEAYTIRKLPPLDPKEKSTWAQAEITKEPFAQEEIVRHIKKLHENQTDSVMDRKLALQHSHSRQVNRLLQQLNDKDPDKSFQWSPVQLEWKSKPLKTGSGEKKSTITCYCERSVRLGVDPEGVFTFYENRKREKSRLMTTAPLPPPPRPPLTPRPPPAPLPPAPRPPLHLDLGPFGAGATSTLKSANKSIRQIGSRRRRHGGRHNDEESGSEDSSTETNSRSSNSSSENTSISLRSDHRKQRFNHGCRGHSHHRSRLCSKPLDDQNHITLEPIDAARCVVSFGVLILSGLAAGFSKVLRGGFLCQGIFGFSCLIVAVLNTLLTVYMIKWKEE